MWFNWKKHYIYVILLKKTFFVTNLTKHIFGDDFSRMDEVDLTLMEFMLILYLIDLKIQIALRNVILAEFNSLLWINISNFYLLKIKFSLIINKLIYIKNTYNLILKFNVCKKTKKKLEKH